MKIWAIGDLHLSFGTPNKSMDRFGERWLDHAQKVREGWTRLVAPEDLVLIPGDISWAMKLPQAMPDLLWIHELPGTKVMIKGNHDLWWPSLTQLKKALPPSIHVIQNDVFCWQNRVFVAGARLWDSDEYAFDDWIDFIPQPGALEDTKESASDEDAGIFRRELLRLEESLKRLPPKNGDEQILRIAMTHYPPIGPKLEPSQASALFEKYKVRYVLFGHLHSLKKELDSVELFGMKNGVEYRLASCDWINCEPILVHDLGA